MQRIKHQCHECGCDLGYFKDIFNRNYEFFRGKYYCKECREDLE